MLSLVAFEHQAHFSATCLTVSPSVPGPAYYGWFMLTCAGLCKGAVVQRTVFWQMENGCPFMMSWNEGENVGFVIARDNDIIAHERKSPSAVEGVICALHGGSGYLNNWYFLNNRLENYQWALISMTIANNPWGTSKQLGSISTILIRNLSSSMPFASPQPFHVSGNASANARIDNIVYEGVTIAGNPLTELELQQGGGMGQLVTNVTVCGHGQGCGNTILTQNSVWSNAQVCGRTPQPSINGVQFPPLSDPDLMPYCS